MNPIQLKESINLIAARSLNGVIGNGTQIPWKVKGEQQLFKTLTEGAALIMGRLTFESIGRPLPGRESIVVTRNRNLSIINCICTDNLESAITTARTTDRPIFIIGGGEIYKQALDSDLIDHVHLSTIQSEVEGDVFFPSFPTVNFKLKFEKLYESNINYLYQHFERTSRIAA
jgi:dihydrofolate reductase